MITPEQQQFMSATRPHYDTLINAGFLTNIGQPEKNGLLEVARVFAPAYQANLWCGPCVCELVKFAFTQYDKWREGQNIQAATFPKQDPPVVKEPAKRGRKPKSSN